MSRLRRWSAGVLVAAAFCVALAWTLSPTNPLPGNDDVAAAVATGWHGPARKLVDFDVPLEHWPRIRAALGKPTRDPNPSKWVEAGSVRIATRVGSSLNLQIYSTNKPPGAFAIGPTFEQRVYYRGGDSEELSRAMEAAYEAALDQGRVRPHRP